jgi:hypothetical protein
LGAPTNTHDAVNWAGWLEFAFVLGVLCNLDEEHHGTAEFRPRPIELERADAE